MSGLSAHTAPRKTTRVFPVPRPHLASKHAAKRSVSLHRTALRIARKELSCLSAANRPVGFSVSCWSGASRIPRCVLASPKSLPLPREDLQNSSAVCRVQRNAPEQRAVNEDHASVVESMRNTLLGPSSPVSGTTKHPH